LAAPTKVGTAAEPAHPFLAIAQAKHANPLRLIDDAKGESGGDILHRVRGPFGQPCGSLLWESKRTKAWNDAWLVKLRDDQRHAKAEVALIVLTALPKDVETFDLVVNVWVTQRPSCSMRY